MGLFKYLPEDLTLWHWMLLTIPCFLVFSSGFCTVALSGIFFHLSGSPLETPFGSSTPQMLLFLEVAFWSSSFCSRPESTFLCLQLWTYYPVIIFPIITPVITAICKSLSYTSIRSSVQILLLRFQTSVFNCLQDVPRQLTCPKFN